MRIKARSPGQNGVRERAFGSLKYERLYLLDIADGDQLSAHAEDYRLEFNHIRPHEALAWNRPKDVHLGLADPDRTQLSDRPNPANSLTRDTKIASKSLLVRRLNALVATVCTPLAAPVVATARLRGGNAGSARGAAGLVAEAIATAREAGCTGIVVVRADSAYYGGGVRRSLSACRGALLDHRQGRPEGSGRDRRHRRRRVGRDQVPRGDLRRGQRPRGSPTPRSPRCATPRSPPAAPTPSRAG